MNIPQTIECLHKESQTIDSRPVFDEVLNKWLVRRRRLCHVCDERFTTIEIPIHSRKKTYRAIDSLRDEFTAALFNKALDSISDLIDDLRIDIGD